MEEVFIEQLDQVYWPGYAEQFREDNSDAYQRQLAEFTNAYKPQKNGLSIPLHHRAGSHAIPVSKRNKHGRRGGNTGDLFAK